jgi:chromosome segregation ATPase
MPDDRALRDALEKVQFEVKELREQLAGSDAPAQLRDRLEQLQALRTQQRGKLGQGEAEVAQLLAQLALVQQEVRAGKAELAALREQEARLVDLTLVSLDPGPRAGCAPLLLAFAAGLLELLR